MSNAARQFLTLEEYLDFEETSQVRHEFVGGALYAMTGGLISHNRATLRLVRALLGPAEGDGCEVFASDVRFVIEDAAAYYPDVMVGCDPNDTDDRFRRWPCLVAEVLSPSMQAIDRREKLLAYSSVSTVLTYLLIDPPTRRVEAHIRADVTAAWTHSTFDITGTITLPCPAMDLRVSDLFPA